MASEASSAANETTATFDLTHKRDKSNIIYHKPIKNQHPDKIKSVFSKIKSAFTFKIDNVHIDDCAYISMFILLTAYSTAGRNLRVQRSNS
jgi:hypothetical protein